MDSLRSVATFAFTSADISVVFLQNGVVANVLLTLVFLVSAATDDPYIATDCKVIRKLGAKVQIIDIFPITRILFHTFHAYTVKMF